MRCNRPIAVCKGAGLRVMPVLLTGASMNLFADSAAERPQRIGSRLEIMNTPDQRIPEDLLNSANCVVIVPGLKKAGFVVGAKYGRGFAICRKNNSAGWELPLRCGSKAEELVSIQTW